MRLFAACTLLVTTATAVVLPGLLRAQTPAARGSASTVAHADRPSTMLDPGTSSRVAPVESLDRYERGEWTPSIAPLATKADLDYLFRAAPAWIKARGAAQQSRRRLAFAGYVLELLIAHARDIAIWQPGQFAAPALEKACEILRAGPAVPGELWWHAGSIGLLEQVGVGSSLARHVRHAEGRFPAEGRWALARVALAELQTWPERRDENRFSISRELEARLTHAFTTAAVLEPFGPEVHLRWGYFELRRGRIAAALAQFDRVGAPADVHLRYWLHLFRGQALERADRLKDAIASYQLAVSDAPDAQSAVLALGAALVEDHRPSEAAALVYRMTAVQPAPYDPWDQYLSPDARFLPLVIEQLHRAIKP